MNIHKLADVVKDVVKDKTFYLYYLSAFNFQRGNYSYSIKGHVFISDGLATFTRIDSVLQYHIATCEEVELNFTESEKKLLLYHLYKLEL